MIFEIRPVFEKRDTSMDTLIEELNQVASKNYCLKNKFENGQKKFLCIFLHYRLPGFVFKDKKLRIVQYRSYPRFQNRQKVLDATFDALVCKNNGASANFPYLPKTLHFGKTI